MLLPLLLFLLAAPGAAAQPGQGPARLHGHHGAIFFLAFPRRDLLISAAPDGARVWDPETGKTLEELSGPSIAAAYSDTAGLLAVSRADGGIIIYDSAAWTPTAELRDTGGLSLSLAFSGNGDLLAASGTDGRVRYWKTADWTQGPELAAAPGPFRLAGFADGGNILATFSPAEPILRLWDLRANEPLYWLKSPLTLAAFFDPRGRRLAAAGADRTLRVWESGGGLDKAPVELEAGPMASAAFSASGDLLASAGLDGSLAVWDPGDGGKAVELRDSRSRASALAFSPSGLYLASGETGGDITLRMWAAEAWTSSGNVPVKNPGGKTLTLLPAGVRLSVLKAPPGAAHWLVSDGTGLSGWAPAAALAPVKPDLLPPVIRITSQAYAGGVLSVKGAVYDDGRLDYVRFSGKDLPGPAAGAKAAPGCWPFELSIELTPDTVPVLEAGDLSGKTGKLALNLHAPPADYTPGYILLRPQAGAGIFREADAKSPLLARAAAGSVLAALGKRGAWYFLEGGGWLKRTSLAAEVSPAQFIAGPISVADTAGPEPVAPGVQEKIPQGKANPRALAIVIGVKDYLDSDIPRAEYALEDAAAVRRHLITALGFAEGRVIFLENPTKGQLETFFGGTGAGRLKELVRKGETELFVYYSGHGAADPEAGAAYLVPSDARPDSLRLGGFPLARLYSALEDSGAAQVTVVIEACFSGLSHAGPLLGEASPLILAARRPEAKKINIFSSSAADQVSSWYPAEHRGLFTYYFLKALRENCCGPAPLRLGTLKELTGAEVPAAAMRLYGRTQTPLFTGDPAAALSH
jgi:hypothetical protein